VKTKFFLYEKFLSISIVFPKVLIFCLSGIPSTFLVIVWRQNFGNLNRKEARTKNQTIKEIISGIVLGFINNRKQNFQSRKRKNKKQDGNFFLLRWMESSSVFVWQFGSIKNVDSTRTGF